MNKKQSYKKEEDARRFVESMKPETTAEARSYARAYWDKQSKKKEMFIDGWTQMFEKEKCCCDYKAEGVCRMTGRHVICEHKKWWEFWK